ncbi:DUF6460 domain-containing protein [Paremcibacter congregatus]|uniref:DUF6460 domain-containing protein n=1 Tax=Paremcibacter congregatus TaxID=2043170 RepID=A0A2G4YU19_9PROT|nr:DUF6460 domain-containing protein [Paremcibacter congregatus]PHZ85825.1 hypothetical protein CRD36_03860 [Paremcibacter congregatus]QDE26788.1 hypothetical protein FIV45_05625 [Paremcibacter congregatus]
MNKSTLHVVWKLVIVSLLVGLALDFFDVSPVDLIHDIPDTVAQVFDAVVRAIQWGGKYVLLGAIIVVPVWLLMNIGNLKGKFRNKNKP